MSDKLLTFLIGVAVFFILLHLAQLIYLLCKVV